MDETIKDIAADLRARAARAEAAVGFPTVEAENDRRLAGRIEAAAERERAVLDANIARVRKLEDMLGGAADAVLGATIKQKAAGDASAMHKALEDVVEYLGGVIRTRRENELVKSARAALAAPARNCDILSEEEANEAWDEYRHSHVLPRGGWDFRHVIAWLFAKAERKEDSNG